jgi:putative hydrolases of HD superfamily
MNLRELLNGDCNRLRYVTRYSTAFVAQKESAAEHIYFVTLYSFCIAEWVESNTHYHVDKLLLLKRAILHDLEEARTGDIYRPFKHSNPDLRELMEQQGLVEFKHIMTHVFSDSLRHDSLQRELSDCWLLAKDEASIEGLILSFADYLSVLGFMWNEAHIANSTMHIHYDSMYEYAQRFEKEKYEVIRPLVNQAKELWEEVFGNLRAKPADKQK